MANPTIIARGMDVAEYQHWIDHATAAAAEPGGFYACKATLGITKHDPFHFVNVDRADPTWRARLEYHWVTPSATAADQVAWFLKWARRPAGWGVMLDAEQDGITEPLTYEVADRIEQVTQRPCAIYTGLYVAGSTIWRSTRLFDGRRARVLAAYTTEANMFAKCAAVGPWVPDVWQNQGSTGRWPGVGALTDGGPMVALACDNDQVYAWDRVDLATGYTVPPTPTPPGGEMLVKDKAKMTDGAEPIWVTDGITKRWEDNGNVLTALFGNWGALVIGLERVQLDQIPNVGPVPPTGGWTDHRTAFASATALAAVTKQVTDLGAAIGTQFDQVDGAVEHVSGQCSDIIGAVTNLTPSPKAGVLKITDGEIRYVEQPQNA